jgi:hypothetical protein
MVSISKRESSPVWSYRTVNRKKGVTAHDSWEPPENLANAHEVIRDFHHTHPQVVQHIILKEQTMTEPSPSHSPLPSLNKLIIAFDKLCISMPSHNSSTENLIDQILNQPWRSPTNPVTGEVIPYCTNDVTTPTTGPNSPTSKPNSANSPAPLHVQILE